MQATTILMKSWRYLHDEIALVNENDITDIIPNLLPQKPSKSSKAADGLKSFRKKIGIVESRELE